MLDAAEVEASFDGGLVVDDEAVNDLEVVDTMVLRRAAASAADDEDEDEEDENEDEVVLDLDA